MSDPIQSRIDTALEVAEKATKGPWRWDGDNKHGEPYILSGDNELIATVHHECVKPNTENEVNADLIALATAYVAAIWSYS